MCCPLLYLQEIKPGDVLNKKNLWEGITDTLSSGKEGKVCIHTLVNVSALLIIGWEYFTVVQ